MSQILGPLALHAGKEIITRYIKGRKVRMCPHCNGKIYIRGGRKVR